MKWVTLTPVIAVALVLLASLIGAILRNEFSLANLVDGIGVLVAIFAALAVFILGLLIVPYCIQRLRDRREQERHEKIRSRQEISVGRRRRIDRG